MGFKNPQFVIPVRILLQKIQAAHEVSKSDTCFGFEPFWRIAQESWKLQTLNLGPTGTYQNLSNQSVYIYNIALTSAHKKQILQRTCYSTYYITTLSNYMPRTTTTTRRRASHKHNKHNTHNTHNKHNKHNKHNNHNNKQQTNTKQQTTTATTTTATKTKTT